MSKMGKVLKIFIAIVIHLSQIAQGYSKRLYQLNINERGTSFNESIEVDDTQKRVVYHVPSHNGIRKSDTLVDYKNGLFVTKMIEREKCYIKGFPIAEEQSIRETKQNLELLEVIKKRFKNTSIPVETVTKIMKIIREIPREELSPKILEFCGNSTAYEVEEKLMPQKKENYVTKRSGPVTNTLYRMRFRPSFNLQGMKTVMPNGYLTCKNVKDHNQALFSCLEKGKTPLVGCGLFPRTCRYQAFCKILPAGKTKIPSRGSIGTRHDLTGAAKFNFVDIKCVEQHKFTVNWCCDVLPCN